jgi:hypothetical protein
VSTGLSDSTCPTPILTPIQFNLKNTFHSERHLPLNDLRFVSEYLKEIYINLKMEERLTSSRPRYGYMKEQPEVNEQMRAILIDWIIDVHLKFRLKDETLFLTVHLLDRFLSVEVIPRTKLQLVGVTSLFIACKQEEIYTPHLSDFVKITDDAYKKEDIIQMESIILKKLHFHILVPSPLRFYEIISLNFEFSPKQIMFGRYLLEVFLLDYKMTRFTPSLIACTAAYMVMKLFRFTNYQEIYGQFYNSNNNSTLLKECAKEICFLVENVEKSILKAAKRKFSSTKYYEVSQIDIS